MRGNLAKGGWTAGLKPVDNAAMNLSSYSHGTFDTPLLGDTIGAHFERTAARFADRPALVSRDQDVRMTYAELDAAIDAVAGGLLRAGIEAGDRVGIWAPNCAEWVLVQYATAKVGAILVNVNPAYRTHELEYVLRQSGVRLLFSASAFKTSDYGAMIDEVSGGLDGLERTVFVDRSEWAEFSAGAADREAIATRMQTLSFDDPINIQYTSGTTGFPKGATLSHHNILNNGYFVTELLNLTERDVTCLPVPFYHCFGMVMGNLGTLAHGGCVVIPAPGFDPGATLEAVAAEGVTSLYGVPTMFIAMLDHPDFDRFELGSLRTGIMAGSPCPIEVMKKVVERMHMEEVSICYGMTETSPVSTQTRLDDSLERRVGTVGRVAPHVEVKVIDPDSGLVVRRGVTGELCTRGYSVMLEYWEDPDQTAEAVDRVGWMHTGDLATMDDEGYLNIVGRSKDMVIRGGENVYPREVEEFLYAHESIADVSVIGVPDERYGEELCAWVIARPGATLDEDTVRDYCRKRLAHFKVPRYVLFVDDFPMTVTGKVQKFKMREVSIERLGLEAAAAVQSA
jgi:fatty-acyl-CoA synthase